MTSLYWILFIDIALASWIVSASLERKFKRYAQESLPMTGKDVAEKMLRDNGIYDVKITCIKGQLTDHYNPATKTVNLSEDVYRGANVAAAAVAAHECGHACQAYSGMFLYKIRQGIAPAANITSRVSAAAAG